MGNTIRPNEKVTRPLDVPQEEPQEALVNLPLHSGRARPHQLVQVDRLSEPKN